MNPEGLDPTKAGSLITVGGLCQNGPCLMAFLRRR